MHKKKIGPSGPDISTNRITISQPLTTSSGTTADLHMTQLLCFGDNTVRTRDLCTDWTRCAGSSVRTITLSNQIKSRAFATGAAPSTVDTMLLHCRGA